MKPIRLGFLFMLPYLLYVLYCIALAISRDDAGTQVMLAVLSLPASMAAFEAARPILDWLGPYGDSSRHVGEWTVLLLAGCAQYFLLGYFSGKWAEPGSAETVE